MITFVFALRFTSKLHSFKGFLSLGWFHIRIAFERQKMMSVIDASSVQKEMAKKKFVMDSTKQRTLMPSNQRTIKSWGQMTGIEKANARAQKPPMPKKTPTLDLGFTHRFFGSELVIGDHKIGRGLSRSLHTLEITKDRLMIDNVPQEINQGELETIKALLREVQKGV